MSVPGRPPKAVRPGGPDRHFFCPALYQTTSSPTLLVCNGLKSLYLLRRAGTPPDGSQAKNCKFLPPERQLPPIDAARMKIRVVLLVRSKSKAKPEILKHGGNGGKNPEGKSEGFRGCNVDRTFSSARKIAADLTTYPREILRFFLWFFPPFPPCFKISGFVFCRFPRKASSPPGCPSRASIA